MDRALATVWVMCDASLKVGIAASLVGAIVGELPTGAAGGLGSRLLAGSYYGQTIQIWAALIAAADYVGKIQDERAEITGTLAVHINPDLRL